jgi:hypothetical protein
LFGNEFLLEIDKDNYSLQIQIFDDMALFDDAMSVCEELAEQTQKRKDESLKTFTNILKTQCNRSEVAEQIVHSFYEIYRGLKKVKEAGRDSIWKFIIQNSCKPFFLAQKFDYVIGNPPWFTFSSINNQKYQDELDKLAKEYNVKPERKKNYPNLEIAAIFLAYCSSYFLNSDGAKIAFVLPRSFFSADHHDNTRSGRAKGFKLTAAWDLDGVAPLFRVPSCVLFAEKNNTTDASPRTFVGKVFGGKPPVHNCNWQAVEKKLTENDVEWFYIQQGNSSAFSLRQSSGENKHNPYKEEFRRGAELTPRSLYFVDIAQQLPPDFNDRVINVRTSPAIQSDAKKPWVNIELKDRVESQFLFRTALSKSILPFTLFQPNLVTLPLTIKQKTNGDKAIVLHTADGLREAGFLNAARWFTEAEKIWDERKTEKSKNISAVQYLNWQNKLAEQNLNKPYLVLYNASAQDANSTVIKRADFDLNFIVDTVTYVYFTTSLTEAYYLSAFFNSSVPNTMMKEFQARGLFGARHVHKKILDVYFPRFDAANEAHLRLAQLSEAAHQQAANFLRTNPPEGDLTPMRLGRLRVEIKHQMPDTMDEIDEIVRRIIAS